MKRIFHFVIIFTSICLIVSCSESSNNQANKSQDETKEVIPEIEVLNKKIIENGNNDALFIDRAKYYLNHQLADSAIRDIFFAIDINDKEPAHFVLLSDAYLVLGNPDKSKESLDKALLIDPKSKQALLKLATLYLYTKSYDESFKTIAGLLQIDKINPEAYFIRGYGLMESGDTIAAISDFKAAADQNQDYYDAYLQLGIIYSAQHNPLAVEYLNTAIKIRHDIIQPYYHLALFFQENNQTEKAISTYQAILGIEPGFVYALYNLGYINLVYEKDFTKAIEYFTKVVEIEPTYAEAWYNRGWSYELAGNADLARKDYKKTLEISTNFALAIEGLNRLDN
jgi:tetratricopeptide (TPR) repeat protein